MHRLSYENHAGVPVFRSSPCGRCSGIETENVFAANRGCCFYYPKYTLIDLRTVAAIDPAFLRRLRQEANAVIEEDCLVVRGLYDQAAHEAFCRDPEARDQDRFRGFDTSLLFRKCALCSESGCTIDFRLRPHPCNLYLCRDVVARCGERYREYARERQSYFAYCRYMNGILADALRCRGISLTADFDAVVAALLETEIGTFEFAGLELIDFA